MQKKSEETILELPSPDSKWTPRRKAAVIKAVRDGRISIEEACHRYRLSADEFQAWERDLHRYGVPGLRSTRYQIYRDTSSAAKSPLPRHIGPAHTARHGLRQPLYDPPVVMMSRSRPDTAG